MKKDNLIDHAILQILKGALREWNDKKWYRRRHVNRVGEQLRNKPQGYHTTQRRKRRGNTCGLHQGVAKNFAKSQRTKHKVQPD